LAIPFAVVGYINDSEKYKNTKLDDNQLGMIFAGTFHFISDLSIAMVGTSIQTLSRGHDAASCPHHDAASCPHHYIRIRGE
jgi:hypothetical protein